MELSTLFIHIAFAITTCKGFILLQNAPRKVVKILTVNNGGGWGSWHGPQFCADGTYAVGYNMKASIILAIRNATVSIPVCLSYLFLRIFYCYANTELLSL